MDTLSQLGMISTPEVGFYLTRTESESELVFGSPHDKYVENKKARWTGAELLFSPHADQSKKITLPKSTTGDGLYRVIMDASFLMDTWCKVQTTASVWRKLRSSLILGKL